MPLPREGKSTAIASFALTLRSERMCESAAPRLSRGADARGFQRLEIQLPALMPISLFVSWTALSGCVNSHQRHAANFRGSSESFRQALQLSTVIGFVTEVGLLIYYLTQSTWYWPILLFLGGSVAAGLIFGLLDVLLGPLLVSVLSFVCWPICAYWSYSAIASLPHN